MKEYTLYADRMNDREKAHAYLKEQLELPEYYGANLDALMDCLTEITQKTKIVVDCNLPKDEAGYYGKIEKILSLAEKENPNLLVICKREVK